MDQGETFGQEDISRQWEESFYIVIDRIDRIVNKVEICFQQMKKMNQKSVQVLTQKLIPTSIRSKTYRST